MASESGLDLYPLGPLGQQSVGDELQQGKAGRRVADCHASDRLEVVGPHVRQEVER